MPDLLLEVLSEEIPARMQRDAARDLERQVLSRLAKARLFGGQSESFVTPRRLAVLVRDLLATQSDITVERKGPRVDAPQRAIDGFLKSTGLTLEDCEQRETPRGPVWFAVIQEKGRPAADLLAELLPEALAAISWPKSMRWEESGASWVRPIRSIVCLLDDAVVPFHFGRVESGRITLGHRFLEPGPHTIADAGSYAKTLESAKVMLDPEQRIRAIVGRIREIESEEGLELAPDKRLIDENAGLVEWPVVLKGRIDARFIDLPPEVLSSAMGTHQRYFGVRRASGRPAPYFIMVSNIETEDGGDDVIAGNERVLRARLADARFFWDQDRRVPLAERLPQLEGVVFHARLGSMADKARRVAKLAGNYFSGITGANSKKAARAGLLCKADLVTEMVGEFPDLQGIMGRYYARPHEEPAVCAAIGFHYAPQGPKDPCPRTRVSEAVALADKLDTLAGFFAIDERPTGSKDPFALRRAALGVIRIVVEKGLRLSLGEALTEALAGYNGYLPSKPGPKATRHALLGFFADRFKVHLREQGVRHDLVSAVFGARGEDDLVRLRARVMALERFLDDEDGANLLIAYRRAANILRIEEKKDGQRYDGEADATLFTALEEQTLYGSIAIANATVEPALESEFFEEAMTAMATLRAPVDAFFDNVTVNCEDPALRHNRLLMLSQIRSTLDRVADFSKIEG